MMTETYRGRRLRVQKGREPLTLAATVNGEPVPVSERRDQAKALDELRRKIDEIGDDIDGDRWSAYWYAPNTYELCDEDLHPRAIGGTCRHQSCGPEPSPGNGVAR